MVKSSSKDTRREPIPEGPDPTQRVASHHAHIRTAEGSDVILEARIFPVTRLDAMVEAALDLAGCAKIAIRRFHRLATDAEARQRLLALLADAADDDLRLRKAELLTNEIAGTATEHASDPYRDPVFLSAARLRSGAATELPPSCAAAMVVSLGEITRILVSNSLGLARTADICVHMVAAAIVNRAGHLGLVSQTSRQVEALAQLAGAQRIAADWRFVAVRDSGVVRYGIGLFPAEGTAEV